VAEFTQQLREKDKTLSEARQQFGKQNDCYLHQIDKLHQTIVQKFQTLEQLGTVPISVYEPRSDSSSSCFQFPPATRAEFEDQACSFYSAHCRSVNQLADRIPRVGEFEKVVSDEYERRLRELDAKYAALAQHAATACFDMLTDSPDIAQRFDRTARPFEAIICLFGAVVAELKKTELALTDLWGFCVRQNDAITSFIEQLQQLFEGVPERGLGAVLKNSCWLVTALLEAVRDEVSHVVGSSVASARELEFPPPDHLRAKHEAAWNDFDMAVLSPLADLWERFQDFEKRLAVVEEWEAAISQKGSEHRATFGRFQAFAWQPHQARFARRALPRLRKGKPPDFNGTRFEHIIQNEIVRLGREIDSLNTRNKELRENQARAQEGQFAELQPSRQRSRAKLEKLKQLCQDE
jgi:hypothetical protein